MPAAFDIASSRGQFPALALTDDGPRRVYFDNPAGTQVPQQVIDRTVDCLTSKNANLGGYFKTTVEAGELVDLAHQACADFYNAASASEIVFGQNMTTPDAPHVALPWQAVQARRRDRAVAHGP